MILQIDSLAIQHALQTGLEIGKMINQNKDFIPGLPNTILSSVITAIASVIIGLIHRKKTLKRLRNEGFLTDLRR